MATTNVINAIGIHATAGTALPTLPSVTGSNITSANWASSGYTVFGSQSIGQNSDVGDLGEDTLDIAIETILAEIVPTRSLAVEDYVLISRKVQSFMIPFYDQSEVVFAVDSNFTITSNIAQIGTTLTERALAVEINTLGIIYFPNVIIDFAEFPVGYGEDGVMVTKANVRVKTNATFKGGIAIEWY